MKFSHVFLQTVRFCAIILLGIVLVPLGLANRGPMTAQEPESALTRTFDPVILAGSQLSIFDGVSLGDLFVYAYEGDTWSMVPFQFDEVDSGGAFVASEDGLLDSNDKLVFMAADMGSAATAFDWLGDEESRSYSRYEVRVTNPLNSAEEGWVYVYRSSTLSPTFSPYVTWDNANNRIVASTYAVGYAPSVHGGMDSFYLNGSEVDVLDRSKIRISGACYAYGSWNNFSMNEESDDIKGQVGPPDIQGPVRQGGGTLDQQSWSYASLFESGMVFDAGAVQSPCTQMRFDLFRISMDWRNPADSGMAPMTYYDSNTEGGVPVDGITCTIPITPVTSWWEVSGAGGSFVQVADVTPGGGTATNYYKDDQTVDSGDTGDQQSFGDSGYQLTSPTALVTMAFTNYVLGPDQGNVGSTYQQYHANPLETTITAQNFECPLPPTLDAISNADGNGDYLVDWSDVTGATSYELQEDDNASFSSATVRYSDVDSQYQVTGQAGGTWYYRVRALNSNCSSPWSETQSASVVPVAPTLANIDNADGNGDYLVNWSDVAGATEYELEEDDSSSFNTPTTRYSGATSEFQVSGQPGGTWYYRVRASNAGGDSAWSATRSVGVVPAAPTLADIDNPDGVGDYLVDWNDVAGATGYELEEADNAEFDSPTQRYSGSTSEFQVSGQGSGLWYYRVRASNATGNGAWSESKSVGVGPIAPALAEIENADGNGDYLVNWSDVTGATGYELEEADNAEFDSPTQRYSGATSEFQVTGQPGGTWYYRVRSNNAGGDSAWSNVESVGVVPAAPTLAAIDNADGDGSYLVDWSDVTGATGYELEEDDNSGFSTPTTRYSGSTSEFQVSGQGTGSWYYRVRASNATGNGAWSATRSVSVVPGAPTLADIDNADGNGDYLVNWSDVAGATEYELEEDDNAGFDSPTQRYSGATSQFQVSGQATGLWYYRVRAISAGGDGAWSNVKSVGVVPAVPTLADIDNPEGDGSYLVNWSDVAGATSYELEEDDNAEFDSPTQRYSGSTSQYQVSAQAIGLWYYRVRASNAGGDSAWSNVESAGVVPPAPVLAAIDNPDGNGDYLVNWGDVTGAIGYELEEDDNAGFDSPTQRYSGATSQFQVSGQATGLWYYRARAIGAGGNSAWSTPESVGVVPAAPVLADIDNPGGDGNYLVDWSDVTGATGYLLEEDDDAAFNSPTVRYSGSASEFQVSGQETGLWHYRVRASTAGGDGAWSNVESVGVVPAAPVLPAIDNPEGDGDYLVNWSDVAGATSYELEEDDNSSFSTPTVRYSGATSQYEIRGQGTGLWYYRVRASNAGGDSDWSETRSVSVVPGAPTLADISNEDGNGDYLVNWSDVAGATGYRLEEDDNAEFDSPTERYSGATSQYQVSGQATGLWYYRVQASNAQGNSAWSNTESVGVVPAAPVLAAIDNPDGNGEYLVDWNDVTGATNYVLEEDDSPEFTAPTVRYNGPSSRFQISGQETGLWYYRVRASNAGGNSAWSTTESVGVVPAAPVLAAISNEDGNGNYLVNWNDVAGATSYELQEDDNAEFDSATERYSGATSQYQVNGQATGLWYYRVRASNSGGNSAWSNVQSVGVVPAAPTLADISNADGNGDYLVNWNDVAGATSYRLEEDDNAEFDSPTERYSGSASQYQVSGQGTGLWYYRVRASNAGGNSAWSSAETVGVVPAAPVLAAIDNPDGNGEYLVDWSDVAGATNYVLEEDDSAEFTAPTVRYNGPSSRFQISGQAAGLWYYRVRASNAGGNSTWSTSESVGVVPAAPVLADISNADGNGSYLVNWNDVAGATSYRLEEDDNAEFSSPTARYTGATSQYQVSGQATGLWYYRVRASSAGGNSAWSSAETVGVVPGTPSLSDIANTDGDGAYLVNWSDVAGAVSYQLEEDDNSGFTSPTVRYNGADSEYQVTGQAEGTWYYRVRAGNAGGDGSWSNTEPVTVIPPDLDAPLLLPIDNSDGNGEYLVDWNDVAGTVAYRLEEDDDPYFASPTVRYTGATSRYQVTGQAGGTWYYRVQASNAGGDSPWSTTRSASVIPAAPELLAIGNSDRNGEYLVDWTNATGAASYQLEEDDNSSFSSPTVRYNGANSQYQVSGQGTGRWYYRVRASNPGGNSAWSNVGQVDVAPISPVLYPIDNPDGNGDYLVDWGDVTGATSYRLEEDDNAEFSSPTARYTGAASQYQVSGQATGLWYYRVRASNASGSGPWSGVETVGVIPGAPSLSDIANADGDGAYLVNWSDVAGTTSYELQEDDSLAFSSPTVRYSGATSQYQVTGQATGRWYYRVRARNAGGDSPWSTTRQVGVFPAAPALQSINNPDGDGDYLVDWSEVTGAASYELEEDDNSEFASPTVRYTGTESRFTVSAQRTGLWYYRVRASNAGGDSAWSNTVSVAVIPPAPVLTSIGNTDGDGDYLVEWGDVAGATSYLLEEDDNSEFSSPTVRYTGADSRFQVIGRGTGLWYYRVRAGNAGGDSPWSNMERVSVLTAAPELAPIENADGNGQYLVDWSDVTGAITYSLEEDDDPGFGSPTMRYNGVGSAFQITAQPGGTWYYRVRASNHGGDGFWSNTESANVISAAPLLNPIVNPNGSPDYLVDWNSTTGAVSYQLEEDVHPAFISPTIRYDGPSSQFQLSGQATGRWYYRVRAVNAAGNSLWSNIVSAGVVPAYPVLASVSNPDGERDYLVDWDDVAGAIGYQLEEDDNRTFSSPTVRYTGASSEYQVHGQDAGRWYYRVRANNAGGDGPWSNSETVAVLLAAPKLLPISDPDKDGSYMVEWTAVPGGIAYTLEEDETPDFDSPVTRYDGMAIQCEVVGRLSGQRYYRVRASNLVVDGHWSDIQSVSVPFRFYMPLLMQGPVASLQASGEAAAGIVQAGLGIAWWSLDRRAQ